MHLRDKGRTKKSIRVCKRTPKNDGLAFSFTRELTELALALCHQEVFERIGTASLADLVREIEAFIRSTNAEPHKVLDAWKKLQPYRVLIPQDCDSLTSEFFFSNIRIALAVLEARLLRPPNC